VDISADAIHVATGHGGRLAIEQLQPEGRRAMSAREFAAGRRLKPGMKFTH
jgi:methionyl-tRNA formyltransferase